MKTIFKKSKEVLNLKYLKTIDKIPPHLSKLKIVIEFARDAALHIIASQHSVESGQAKTCDCKEPMILEKSYCTQCGKDIYPPAV